MMLHARATRTVLAIAVLQTTLLAQSSLKYPQPRKGDVVDDYFGTKVADPYRWMEDLNSPELKQWVDAENGVTFKYLDSLPVRDALKFADCPKTLRRVRLCLTSAGGAEHHMRRRMSP